MRNPQLLAASLLLALPAQAGSVYLNNVNIDGVTNQKFEKATVRLDDKGNVFIDAPGYAVKAVEGTPAPKGGSSGESSGPASLTKRYWLVTEQTVPGMSEFDIDLYVNAKWIRKLRNGDDQLVYELTRHLVPGKNTILFTAHKVQTGQARKSFSSEHVYRVIVGEGNVGGENVMIDNAIVKFERSAAEASDVSQEYVLTTR
ncbi:MAG: hypothetical protein ACYC8T_20545 [Myxococcaceae bacterium]